MVGIAINALLLELICPHLSTENMIVMQVRIIFQPVLPQSATPAPILVYGEYFQYSHRYTEQGPNGERIFIPEPGIDMFVVSRHLRSNGTRMGDVALLQNVQQVVQLVPKFGKYADAALTKDNSMEIGQEYYINNLSDKETFHAILSYQ